MRQPTLIVRGQPKGVIIADEVDRYPVSRGTHMFADLAVRPQQPSPQRPAGFCPVCGVVHLERRR